MQSTGHLLRFNKFFVGTYWLINVKSNFPCTGGYLYVYCPCKDFFTISHNYVSHFSPLINWRTYLVDRRTTLVSMWIYQPTCIRSCFLGIERISCLSENLTTWDCCNLSITSSACTVSTRSLCVFFNVTLSSGDKPVFIKNRTIWFNNITLY